MVETFPTIFKGFTKEFVESVDGWRKVFNSPEPMETEWPNDWMNRVN